MFLFFLTFLSSTVYAFTIHPSFQSDNGHIDSVISYDYLENNRLYTEIFVRGRALNETLANGKYQFFDLSLDSLEGNNQSNIYLINLSICKGYARVDGNYKNMNFNCTDGFYKPINDIIRDNSLKFRINLSEVYESGFHIKLVYYQDNFLIENGRYEVAWLDTLCTDNGCNKDTRIERYLILPSASSVIENWNNFEITGKGGNGNWLLKAEGNGEAMVWFSDAEKERNNRFWRDIALISLALGATLISECILQKKKKIKLLIGSIITIIPIYFLIIQKI